MSKVLSVIDAQTYKQLYAFVAYAFLLAADSKEVIFDQHVIPIDQELIDNLSALCTRESSRKKMADVKAEQMSAANLADINDTGAQEANNNIREHEASDAAVDSDELMEDAYGMFADQSEQQYPLGSDLKSKEDERAGSSRGPISQRNAKTRTSNRTKTTLSRQEKIWLATLELVKVKGDIRNGNERIGQISEDLALLRPELTRLENKIERLRDGRAQ